MWPDGGSGIHVALKMPWPFGLAGSSPARATMKEINKDNFIEVCNTSLTMAEASRKLNLHFNTFKRYAIQFNCWNPNQSGKGTNRKSPITKIKTQDIIDGKYPNFQTFKLKNRIFNEGIKERRCECCGLTEWNNLPIPLELHHIDGNRNNHKLENLKILCPNCHAQTETYRAKNIK